MGIKLCSSKKGGIRGARGGMVIEKGFTRRNDVRGGISMHWVVNGGAIGNV